MNNLIKIYDHDESRVVSARELHSFLDSKQDFSTWIKNRIDKFGFIEDQDYTTFHKIVERAKRKEYAITLDMSKELAMVENNEKGRIARRYFIEAENKYRKSIQLSVPQSYAEALELAAKQARDIESKDKLIAIQAPKASFADRVIDMDDSQMVDIGQAAKLLKLPYGRNTFFAKLREDKILFNSRNEPKQQYMVSGGLGYFDLKIKKIERENNDSFVVNKVLVTQKGLFWLSKKYGGEFKPGIPLLKVE
jgi:anti-repressor protein